MELYDEEWWENVRAVERQFRLDFREAVRSALNSAKKRGIPIEQHQQIVAILNDSTSIYQPWLWKSTEEINRYEVSED